MEGFNFRHLLLSSLLTASQTAGLLSQLSFNAHGLPYSDPLNKPLSGYNLSCSLNCPADITINCNQLPTPAVTGSATVSGGGYSISYVDEVSQVGCNTIILRTWTASSWNGSGDSCQQTITIADITGPAITPAPTVWSDCGLFRSYIYTATDNCDNMVETQVQVLDSSWQSSEPCAPGMFRTQTQGGWGANPNGNNPGSYLAANFNAAFPNGLTIGCNNKLRLTSAQAIRDFLPSGTTPAILPPGTMVNPGSAYNNVFAGQLVALTISVGFDSYISDFGSSDMSLGDLEVAGGAFAGYTVNEILALGNAIIGGCSTQFSPSQVSSVIASINENFVDGTTNQNFLDCTGPFDCYLLLNVQVTASDDCGNTSVLNQNIMIGDTSAPVFENAPSEITVECGAEVPQPEISDSCFPELVDVVYTESEVPGVCYPSTIRNWVATDQCGNSSTFTQIIHYTDTQPPVFLNTPPSVNINCGESIPEFTPEITDNCGTATITFEENQTSANCTITIIRTWTATDECGNSSSVSQTIVQSDLSAPVAIDFVPEVTISCDADPSSVTVHFTDDCGPPASIEISDFLVCPGCHEFILRTYTATDECGNVTSLEQIINIRDFDAPVFSDVPADIAISCGAMLPTSVPVVSDNCSEVSLNYFEENISGAAGCSQTIRTWIATDACGNVSSVTQHVTFTDNESPVIIGVPQDITISCGESAPVAEVTATDNCNQDVTLSFDESTQQTACGQVVNRIWTASDDCGNISIATQSITITDDTAPIIIAQPEIIVSCNALAGLQIETQDQCSSAVTVTSADNILSLGCSYDLMRTWTATDACGNSAQFVQLVHVTDNTPPTFISIPPSYQIPCGVPAFYEAPVVTDDCGSVDLQFSEVQSGSGCNFTIQRTWTATDNCGNSSTAGQTITSADNVSPVLYNVPANANYSCNEYSGPPAIPAVYATDNCDTNPQVSFSEQTITGDCQNEFQLIRTWVATDVCGNSVTKTQHITVFDNIAPQFNETPADVEATCGNIPEPPVLTATDNCNANVVIQYQENIQSGGCPVITRLWTATDGCGNTSFVTQNVLITDDIAPTIEVGEVPDGPVSCNNIPPVQEPAVDDNCDENVDVQFNESIVGSGCEFTLIRTWIATDDCGNSTVVSLIYEVQDQTAPLFVSPQPEITIQCNQLSAYTGPTVSDDCTSMIQMSYTEQTFGTGCNYDIERIYSASDLCGNVATFTQIIHVVDTNSPLLSGVPLNTFVSCANIPAPPSVSAIDACSGALPVIFSESQIGSGCSYQILRTWSATDNCGNTTTATQTIFVNDQIAPQIVLSSSSLQLDCTDMIPLPQQPVVTDNCTPTGDINIFFEESVLYNGCTQTIIRTWIAIDNCNNTSQSTQTIVITDMNAPVFSQVPADVNTDCDNIPTIAQMSATDNCDADVAITFNEVYIAGSCPYTLQRSWTATDDCGNTSTVAQKIFIYDNIAPELNGIPENLEVECGSVVEVPAVTATDNCSADVLISFTEQLLYAGCNKAYLRTWTATDMCGNQTSASQTIVYRDTQGPVFPIASETITVECNDIPEVPKIMATDCNNFTQTFTECIAPGACENVYSILRHWIAIDACGNSSHLFQTINVVDNTAPVLSAYPGDITLVCPAIPEDLVVTATDNCNGQIAVSYTEQIIWPEMSDGTPIASDDPAFCVDGKQLIRTWTAQDCAGNVVTHTQTITFTAVEERIPAVLNETENVFSVISTNSDEFLIKVKMIESGKLTVDLYDYFGKKVDRVFEGSVEAGQEYVMHYSKSKLAQGAYLFNLIFGLTLMAESEIVVR